MSGHSNWPEWIYVAVVIAEIVGKHNSLDVTIDERLIELDMGKFTGMPYDEIFNSHGNVFMKFYNGELEIAHNGVETFAQVKKRILGLVDDIIEKHPDENVLPAINKLLSKLPSGPSAGVPLVTV